MAEKKAKTKEVKATAAVDKKVKTKEVKATAVVDKKVKTKETKKVTKATKATAAIEKKPATPIQDDRDKIGGFPAKVVDLVGRTGVRGEIVQVRCEVLEGRDAGKVLIRNVKSPVKAGDILLLSETAMQARKLEARR